ncbi:DUF3011 domain-containing protein [Thermomonas sp.]|jgi:hypothetical protein|uniref:DUF3011 domain-containing protein n=1 Tax=Thermomonas sp. TaxID=1971895 RepID=UPI002591AD0D|nr:DUF3011 domain-containing protein [Thermomonas sp.]HQE08630.1 DUF3011 domain-containing protein [Thermomonas sp.]
MRHLIAVAFTLLAATAAAPASAQYYGGDGYRGNDYRSGRVRCESDDGRYRECPIGDGRATLDRQLSRSACIEGRSWGQNRGRVWVDDGCRADFSVRSYGGGYDNGYGGGYGQSVRCESNDGRYNRCSLPGRGRAQLVRQISNSACIEGRSWGSDYGSVWVNDGCRGDFSVMRGNSGWNGGGWGDSGIGGRVFRCESNDGRYNECAANTRAGVQLIRQLSNSPCIEGRSWGYGRSGIWVAQGCRAEFRSY